MDIELDYLIDLTKVNLEKLDLQRFLKERVVYYLTEKYEKKIAKAVVEQHKLDLLPVLPRVIEEITDFISSPSGVRILAVYKRVSNFLSSNNNSNNDLLAFKKNQSELNATNEDKLVQQQIKMINEQVKETLQNKDFKATLLLLTSLVDPINQFLDNVQVNCEDNALRRLRYSILNKICQIMDKVVAFSELDKK